MIYKKPSILRALQISLGHTKVCSTLKYLGMDIEDPPSRIQGDLTAIGPATRGQVI